MADLDLLEGRVKDLERRMNAHDDRFEDLERASRREVADMPMADDDHPDDEKKPAAKKK